MRSKGYSKPRASLLVPTADSGGKTAGSTWVIDPSWDEFRRVERLYSGPVPRTDPPSGWVFTDMQVRPGEGGRGRRGGQPSCAHRPMTPLQVAAHAFGDPREEKRGEAALPWTYDASIAVLPGYRAYIPEFRALTDAQWKDYVVHRVPAFQKPRVERLKGALPPEGPWPEDLAKAVVRGGVAGGVHHSAFPLTAAPAAAGVQEALLAAAGRALRGHLRQLRRIRPRARPRPRLLLRPLHVHARHGQC